MVRWVLGLVCAGYSFCWALHVTELGSYTPPNLAHYLDCAYDGADRVYICGSGGFSILDVSNQSAPSRIGHLQIQAQQPVWNLAIRGTRGICVSAESGLRPLNLTNHASPTAYTIFESGTRDFQDAQFINDSFAFVCLGSDGIGILNITTPAAPSWSAIHTTGLTYAKAVILSLDAQRAYIADDLGFVVYQQSAGVWSYTTSYGYNGQPSDIQLDGNRVYVALGSGGIVVFDVTTPSSPLLLGQFTTDGLAAKIAVQNSRVAVAEWQDMEVFDATDPQSPVRIGYRFTPNRSMCIAMQADTIVLGDWDVARVYQYGVISGADLDVFPRDLFFPVTAIGSQRMQTLLLKNTGGANVTVSSITDNHPHYSESPVSMTILPGDSAIVTVTYAPVDSQSGTGLIRINSNDGDEPQIRVNTIGNPPPGGVAVGTPAPDFTLPLLGGGDTTLSDFAGRIVVMAFFASW